MVLVGPWVGAITHIISVWLAPAISALCAFDHFHHSRPNFLTPLAPTLQTQSFGPKFLPWIPRSMAQLLVPTEFSIRVFGPPFGGVEKNFDFSLFRQNPFFDASECGSGTFEWWVIVAHGPLYRSTKKIFPYRGSPPYHFSFYQNARDFFKK